LACFVNRSRALARKHRDATLAPLALAIADEVIE
jgi:hypothetical protein